MRASLFLRVVGIEVRKRMAYRADFWIQAFAVFAVEVGIAWFLWSALFRESGKTGIGGWNLETTVLYYVAVILVGKVVRGTDIGSDVSGEIYDGGLTRYLLYPTSLFGFKYAQHLGSLFPSLLQLVLFGAAFPFLLPGADAAPSAGAVAMASASILVANVLWFVIGWALHAVAFWADNVWSLLVMLRFVGGILGGSMLPLGVFPAWARPAIDALPFRHCFAEPVEVLLGRTPPARWLENLAIACGWAAGFAVVAGVVFARGRRRYSGVGI